MFEHVSDATRILREIKLLRLLRHPDIVEIKHVRASLTLKLFQGFTTRKHWLYNEVLRRT